MKKIALIFIAALALMGYAQAQQEAPKASPAPVATPTPAANLALTEKELKDGQAAATTLNEAVQSLNVSLDQARGVGNDTQALTMGWKFVTISRNLAEAQATYNAWAAKVQKDHGCEGCAIQDGKLVPAPKTPATK